VPIPQRLAEYLHLAHVAHLAHEITTFSLHWLIQYIVFNASRNKKMVGQWSQVAGGAVARLWQESTVGEVSRRLLAAETWFKMSEAAHYCIFAVFRSGAADHVAVAIRRLSSPR